MDLFAGGGGASLGIARAIGRDVDLAVNHDAEAIAMHRANHPRTKHLIEDVRKVSPRRAVDELGARPVALLWCSPDCRHFSRAKGSKPVSPRVRGLAWMAVRWAKEVAPRVIMLENVREFREWGPLIPKVDEKGREIYDLHGNPVLVPDPARKGQSFKRFVGTLRGLGYAVEFRDLDAADYGAPTHRRRLFLVARNDGQAIVWPKPTHGEGRKPWRTAAEIIDWSLPCPSIFERKRPLAENTMKRIAAGLRRYVIECAEPFIVTCNHSGPEFRGQGLREPFKTVTGARDAHGLVVPTLIQMGYGERKGQKPRVLDLHKPLGTLVGAKKHALVSAFLAKHYGGQVGADLRRPTPTQTARGTQNQLVSACLVHLNHGEKQWSDVREPMRTITAGGLHHAEVRAFLVKYYGAAKHGQSLFEPLHTATNRARFGLVTVAGEPYAIVDIGMRMLTPRELARAQGFPDTYELTGTKTSQVAKIGNSVPPAMPEALVRANLPAVAKARASA